VVMAPRLFIAAPGPTPAPQEKTSNRSVSEATAQVSQNRKPDAKNVRLLCC
jgi:hypothetical protein